MRSSADAGLDAILKDGVRGTPDVAALAALDGRTLTVMAWHYHDDDLAGPDAAVELALTGLPFTQGDARLTHYRIDESHSNSFAEWKRQGSPIAPTAGQYAQLLAAAQLAAMNGPATAPIVNGQATLRFSLPRQGVSLVVLEW